MVTSSRTGCRRSQRMLRPPPEREGLCHCPAGWNAPITGRLWPTAGLENRLFPTVVWQRAAASTRRSRRRRPPAAGVLRQQGAGSGMGLAGLEQAIEVIGREARFRCGGHCLACSAVGRRLLNQMSDHLFPLARRSPKHVRHAGKQLIPVRMARHFSPDPFSAFHLNTPRFRMINPTKPLKKPRSA